MKMNKIMVIGIVVIAVIVLSSVAYVSFQNAERERMRTQQIDQWRKTLVIASDLRERIP